jgi:hypothetical protein
MDDHADGERVSGANRNAFCAWAESATAEENNGQKSIFGRNK